MAGIEMLGAKQYRQCNRDMAMLLTLALAKSCCVPRISGRRSSRYNC